MKFLLYLIFSFSFYLLSAQPVKKAGQQNRAIDSLQLILKSTDNDSVKIYTINKLSNKYLNIENYGQALKYAEDALGQALKLGNKKETANSYNNIGDVFYQMDKNEQALENYLISLKISREIVYLKGMEDSYSNIGNVYVNQDNYQEALDNFWKSIAISIKTGNKNGMAASYGEIGNMYWFQGNYEEALDNFLKSLKIYEDEGNEKGKANSYNDIGYVYLYKRDFDKALKTFLKGLNICQKADYKAGLANSFNGIGDTYEKEAMYVKALDNYHQCLKIWVETKVISGEGRAYGNIGIVYSDMGNYPQAIANYLKLLKLSKEGSDNRGISDAYVGLGDAYMKQNKLEEADTYLNQSLLLSKEMGNKEGTKESFSSLSQLYEKKGDFKQAYEYHKLFSNIKDTLLNEHSDWQINEMDTKYESEKKEKDIELLNKDKELQQADINKQKIIRNGFIGGLSLALLLAFILFNRYVIKQKLNSALSHKNNELTQKNDLIEKQKTKIIDSITYAQLIQKSILVDESEIKKLLPESFIYYQPKDIVSGDFYWCSKINNKIIIAVADCTGHGVPGAFMSIIGNTILNQVVNEKHITMPSEILRLLNIGIYEALHQEKGETLSRDGMDIALCCVDYDNSQLEYAGAQHPLYIAEDKVLTVIKGDRLTIGGGGMISKKIDPLKRVYTNHLIQIKNDMCIYLFSDGYKDQYRVSDRRKFGIQKFKDLIQNNQHFEMQKQKELFADAHDKWKGNGPQIDDVLIIGLRF